MKVIWESMPHQSLQSVRVLALQQQRFSGALHAHQALELTWIRRGSGVRMVAGTVQPFTDGDMVLVAPGVAHTWQSTGPQPAAPAVSGVSRASGVSAVVVQWACATATCATAAATGAASPTSVAGAAWALESLPEWRSLQAQLWGGGVAAWSVVGSGRAALEAVLMDLAHTAAATGQQGSPGTPAPSLQVLSASLLALAHVERAPRLAIAWGVASPTASTQRRLDPLLRWVHQHWNQPIDGAQAAAVLHVSPAAFSRAFKHRVGKPFSVYLNDLRVAHACVDLLQTDRPVAAIADRCGYPSLSHFHVQFSRRMGCAPQAYRRQAQGR